MFNIIVRESYALIETLRRDACPGLVGSWN